MLPQLIQGATIGAFFIPLNIMTMAALPPEDVAAGSGMMNFIRTTAAAFATSIITTFWDSQQARHHADLVAQITPYGADTTQFIDKLSGLGLDATQSAALMNQMADAQAATMALNDYFAFASVLLIALIGFIWLAKPVKITTLGVPTH